MKRSTALREQRKAVQEMKHWFLEEIPEEEGEEIEEQEDDQHEQH